MSTSLGDFGKLPAELRTEIFLLVVLEKVHAIEPFPILPLSQTSRDIRWEVLPLFHNKGSFQYLKVLLSFFSPLEIQWTLHKRRKERDRIVSRGVPTPIVRNVQIAWQSTFDCLEEVSMSTKTVKGVQIANIQWTWRCDIRRGQQCWKCNVDPAHQIKLHDGREERGRRWFREYAPGSRGVSLTEIMAIEQWLLRSIDSARIPKYPTREKSSTSRVEGGDIGSRRPTPPISDSIIGLLFRELVLGVAGLLFMVCLAPVFFLYGIVLLLSEIRIR
ncbi:uncharacterized protein RCC_08886 [Ramularia collo-cygni]|uniref:F-box domain-containing protein n=1 Tax=Ramularia collo-cygni TaxID=112498 RepID=A0A2D3V1A7_9PEZI|nr:uncharacterized protein RCC_08886 [Ramularia collo-cygni]CZT23176.1 uncharacterized protein RCC_08886 [Ramularia collo-cygni]